MSISFGFHLAFLAQTESAAPTLGSQLILFTASIAWAALWIQLVVLPFFGKAESLHKDYSATGRINAALAAIEADELIPALCRMFLRAIEAQADKRKRPEHEIEALLQSVEFLPDLRTAQEAMSKMDSIQHRYQRLKSLAAGLWKWGLAHTLLTPFLPTVYVLMMPIDARWRWALMGVCVLWIITLIYCVVGLFRIHLQIEGFITSLEVKAVE